MHVKNDSYNGNDKPKTWFCNMPKTTYSIRRHTPNVYMETFNSIYTINRIVVCAENYTQRPFEICSTHMLPVRRHCHKKIYIWVSCATSLIHHFFPAETFPTINHIHIYDPDGGWSFSPKERRGKKSCGWARMFRGWGNHWYCLYTVWIYYSEGSVGVVLC